MTNCAHTCHYTHGTSATIPLSRSQIYIRPHREERSRGHKRRGHTKGHHNRISIDNTIAN